MSKQTEPETSLLPARRSKKLAVVVVILALLPLLLPAPFWGLARLWIGPMIDEKIQACASVNCPASLALVKLSALLVLGPSILVAVASILLGAIGLIRMRWRSTAPEFGGLFMVSVVCGAAWVLLLGCVLWYIITFLVYL